MKVDRHRCVDIGAHGGPNMHCMGDMDTDDSAHYCGTKAGRSSQRD